MKTEEKNLFGVSLWIMLIFLAGVAIGAAAVNLAPLEQCLSAISPMVKNEIVADRLKAFSSSFINMASPVALIWVSGLFRGAPALASTIVPAYRGGVLGYFIGALLRCLGIQKGLIFAVFSAFFQNFLYIPVIIFAALTAFENSRKKTRHKSAFSRQYFYFLALLGVCCAICALCDAYITAFFINLAQKIVKI